MFRIIPSLLLSNKKLVKGKNFSNYINAGNPVTTISALEHQNADEILLIDLDAYKLKTEPDINTLKKIAEISSTPITFGGGVDNFKLSKRILTNGADKVYINTALFHNKGLIDGLVSLPPTAPLRSVAEIDKCLDEFEKGGVDVVITVTDAHRSAYYNMVVNDNNYSSLVIKPDSMVARRQDVPIVFDMTTVAYIVNTDFIKTFNGIFDGKVRSVCIPTERAIDIDTVLDFRIAECLLLDRDT